MHRQSLANEHGKFIEKNHLSPKHVESIAFEHIGAVLVMKKNYRISNSMYVEGDIIKML